MFIFNKIITMSKLIATDLDGTLFYPKHRIRMISKKSLRFIRKFIDEGNQFAIVSGRNASFGFKVAKKINREISIVGCNGAFVYHKNKKIFSKTIDPEGAKKVIEYIEETYKPKAYFIMSNDLVILCGIGLKEFIVSHTLYQKKNLIKLLKKIKLINL